MQMEKIISETWGRIPSKDEDRGQSDESISHGIPTILS